MAKHPKIRGCCSLCGIDDRNAWCERRPFRDIRRMGKRRRVRRNDVSSGM